MALTVTSKRMLEDAMEGGEDDQGRRSYTEVFRVTQTDAGAWVSPVAMAIAAQTVGAGDPLPLRGDAYSYAGLTDLDAFVLNYRWRRVYSTAGLNIVDVTVNYGAASGTAAGRLAEPNPLLWPVEYWLEWVEEQVPVKTAKNVEELTGISRSAFTDGPIVNAIGEETVDPILKTIRYPILCAQKAYANLADIVALNTTYQESTNDNTYFGAAARQAAYLSTESGRIQQTQGQVYYLGVTKIWFKKLTWDLKVLNIGFNEFVKKDSAYLEDPHTGDHQRIRCMVRDVSYDPDTGDAVLGDWVPSSEPLKLDIDGTRLPPVAPAVNITYRERAELNYAGLGIGS